MEAHCFNSDFGRISPRSPVLPQPLQLLPPALQALFVIPPTRRIALRIPLRENSGDSGLNMFFFSHTLHVLACVDALRCWAGVGSRGAFTIAETSVAHTSLPTPEHGVAAVLAARATAPAPAPIPDHHVSLVAIRHTA